MSFTESHTQASLHTWPGMHTYPPNHNERHPIREHTPPLTAPAGRGSCSQPSLLISKTSSLSAGSQGHDRLNSSSVVPAPPPEDALDAQAAPRTWAQRRQRGAKQVWERMHSASTQQARKGEGWRECEGEGREGGREREQRLKERGFGTKVEEKMYAKRKTTKERHRE